MDSLLWTTRCIVTPSVYNTKERKKEGDKKKKKKTDWKRKREKKNITVEEIQQQKGRI